MFGLPKPIFGSIFIRRQIRCSAPTLLSPLVFRFRDPQILINLKKFQATQILRVLLCLHLIDTPYHLGTCPCACLLHFYILVSYPMVLQCVRQNRKINSMRYEVKAKTYKANDSDCEAYLVLFVFGEHILVVAIRIEILSHFL